MKRFHAMLQPMKKRPPIHPFHMAAEGLYSYGGLFVLGRKPVVIYSNGHTGTMALKGDLRRAGAFAFKIEHAAELDKYTGSPRSSHFVKRHIFAAERPATTITYVREPVSLMISWFFSKLRHIPGAKEAATSADLPALQDIFITQYLTSHRGERDLQWFDIEFNRTFNVNVYDFSFDTEAQWSLFTHGPFRSIIMRTELQDEQKAAILREQLDLPQLTLTRGNTREEKPHAKLYEEFKQSLVLPETIFNKIYFSQYARHFVNEAERAAARARWGEDKL